MVYDANTSVFGLHNGSIKSSAAEVINEPVFSRYIHLKPIGKGSGYGFLEQGTLRKTRELTGPLRGDALPGLECSWHGDDRGLHILAKLLLNIAAEAN